MFLPDDGSNSVDGQVREAEGGQPAAVVNLISATTNAAASADSPTAVATDAGTGEGGGGGGGARTTAVEFAASLLGVGGQTAGPEEEEEGGGAGSATTGVQVASLVAALTKRTLVARGETLEVLLSVKGAEKCRDALAKHLYTALFDFLVRRINEAIGAKPQEGEEGEEGGGGGAERWIGILDIFGFERFKVRFYFLIGLVSSPHSQKISCAS